MGLIEAAHEDHEIAIIADPKGESAVEVDCRHWLEDSGFVIFLANREAGA